MMKVEKTVVIKKPVAEVFAYSQNIEYATKWQSGVVAMKMEEGLDNHVGSKYSEVRKFMGQEMKTTMEITAFKENEKWAAKVVKGPVPYEVTMTYTAVPEGTRITTVVEGEPKGFFKLAEGLVASTLDKSLEEDNNHLKALLEGK
jgi:uncharacterized protein YndB with AHSA1/START domain